MITTSEDLEKRESKYINKLLKWGKNNFNLINKLRLKLTRKRFLKVYLTLFEDCFYFINAIHWLPSGFLWSGKLSEFYSGLLGVLAVSCNLILKFKF